MFGYLFDVLHCGSRMQELKLCLLQFAAIESEWMSREHLSVQIGGEGSVLYVPCCAQLCPQWQMLLIDEGDGIFYESLGEDCCELVNTENSFHAQEMYQ